MTPFKIGQGEYIKADDTTRIGQGGFGTVFRGNWHGKDSAFKYLRIRNESNKQEIYMHDVVDKYSKRMTEYFKQLDVSINENSGIIIPDAFYRQQIQIKDGRKWIPENFDVYVYPRYDCNLSELHEKYSKDFTKEIILNILEQCFTRYIKKMKAKT